MKTYLFLTQDVDRVYIIGLISWLIDNEINFKNVCNKNNKCLEIKLNTNKLEKLMNELSPYLYEK